MAQLKLTGITGSLNIIGSVTASNGFFGVSQGGGSSGPAVSYITRSNPPGNINPASSGTLWLNSSTNELFTCVSNTTDRNDWGGTSGSRLYYGVAASSSLTGSTQENSNIRAGGIVSTTYGGTSVSLTVNLRDVYNIALVRTVAANPVQVVGFTMSNATTATSAGTGGPNSYTGSVSTTALTGTVTVTASLDGNLIPNYVSMPVVYPSIPYGLGFNNYYSFGTNNSQLISTGSGGPQILAMLNNDPSSTGHVWVSASCGTEYCEFLRADGTIWGRGYNNNGQLGIGSFTNPVTSLTQINSTAGPWTKISAGYAHTCAINSQGHLYCWGNNTYGGCGVDSAGGALVTPTRETTAATNWVDVSCGAYYTLALKSNGTLWAFGYNNLYQLGDGTTTNRTTPTQVGSATDWVTITRPPLRTNDNYKLGIRGTTLYGWGFNQYGELTSASQGNTITTVGGNAILPSFSVKNVAVSYYGTYVLETSNGLVGWRNQLAVGSSYVGEILGYGIAGANSTYNNSTSYNAPAVGAVQRITSRYIFDNIETPYYSFLAIGKALTGSGAPSGNPSAVSTATSIGNHVQISWTNGDLQAETRVQLLTGSVITSDNYVRPGRNTVFLNPVAGTYTARVSHIKNALHSSGGVTSSAINYCATYGTELSNTCDGSGQRVITYADGSCGTYQSIYCDIACGGYSYQQQICSNQDNCGCGNVYVCFDRYTRSGGGPCAVLDLLQGDYCTNFYGCCCGCGGC